MRKSIKKMMMGTLVAAMLVSSTAPAFAAKKEATSAVVEETKDTNTTKPKKVKKESQKVSKVTCTGSGKINVSFRNQVKYTDQVSAVVKAEDGTEMTCKIAKKNKVSMSISVSGLVKGEKYTVVIEGVKAKNVDEAATITKTFTAKGMKTQCKVDKVEKLSKNVFILKLKSSGYYKDATVTVVDEEGNELDAKIVKKSRGNIKVKATGLVKGKKYTVTVNGVKTKKEKNFSSITKTFTAK